MNLFFTEPVCSGRNHFWYLPERTTMKWIMRVSIFNMFLLLSGLQVLQAHTLNGQDLETTRVVIEMNNESLERLFAKLKETTRFSIGYTNKEIEGITVTFPAAERSVKETLDLALKNKPLSYKLVGNVIMIFKKPRPKGKVDQVDEVQAPNKVISNEPYNFFTVTGKVADANGTALAGVNILVKGTTSGTTSDADGKYTISAGETDFLIFSFIGFKKMEVQVNSRTVIDVSLEEDIAALQEVVINGGYYKTTDKLKTGNIAKIEAKDIENQPVTSPLMALQGRVAGLDITPFNGVPGGAPTIQIRGSNSLSFSGTYPLYIIDGVPIDSRPIESGSLTLFDAGFDPLSTINPSNIESIEVLKDADATSMYGSRGANGVILITTKKGSVGDKSNLEVSVYTGIGEVSNKLDLMITAQYVEMRKEAYANDGTTPSGVGALDILQWDTTRYTDWQNVLLGGTSKITDAQITFSGGNNTTSFRLGGGAHKETMVFPGDFGYKMISGYVNLNHVSKNKKLHLVFSSNYGHNENNVFNDNSFVSSALRLAPNAPKLYDEEGNLNWEPLANGNSSWENPISVLRRTHENSSDNLVANANISYLLIPGLFLKANMGYSYFSNSENLKFPISAINPTTVTSSTTGESYFGGNNRASWVLEPQITYAKDWIDHNFSSIIGSTWQASNTDYQLIRARGYSSDILLGSLQGATNTITTNDNSIYKYNSFFVRFTYDFKNKYLINLTSRRDASSRFGPNNRFGNFGSIGLGWIFSEESFVKNNLKFISFGKIRGSYGTTGNDQIGDYNYYNTYAISFFKYQDQTTLFPNALYNPDYNWELTKKTEAGIELGLLENRVSIELAWYLNNSSNQLINYQLPAITGFSTVLTNFDATIVNKGWELLLNAKLIQKNNFRWNTSINISIPKTILNEFNGIENSSYAQQYKVGESLTIQRLYTWEGVNPQTGLHEFADMNGNGSIDDGDRKFMKSLGKKYFGGIINSFSFNNFELSFLLQFVNQDARRYLVSTPGLRTNQPIEILNRWQGDGDITDVQKFSNSSQTIQTFGRLSNSDYSITDASFLRLKTLSFSYNLPKSLLGKTNIEVVKLYVQGQNLFTITEYVGLDPETGSSRFPPLRMVTMGIQIKL